MTSSTTRLDSLHPAAGMAGNLFDNWFDPLEAEVRLDRVSSLKSCFAPNWIFVGTAALRTKPDGRQ